MIKPEDVEFEVKNNKVILNYFKVKDKDLQIEEDPDGNKFFILPNPYIEYKDRKMDFDDWLLIYYCNRDDISYKTVIDGYADTLVGQKLMFSSFSERTMEIKPIMYLDRKVGELKRKEFDKTFAKLFIGFKWIIEYSSKSSMWTSTYRDENFNAIRFKTKEEAEKLINELKFDIKKILKDPFFDEDLTVKFYNNLCYRYKDKGLVSTLWYDAKGSDHAIINYVSYPILANEDEFEKNCSI